MHSVSKILCFVFLLWGPCASIAKLPCIRAFLQKKHDVAIQTPKSVEEFLALKDSSSLIRQNYLNHLHQGHIKRLAISLKTVGADEVFAQLESLFASAQTEKEFNTTLRLLEEFYEKRIFSRQDLKDRIKRSSYGEELFSAVEKASSSEFYKDLTSEKQIVSFLAKQGLSPTDSHFHFYRELFATAKLSADELKVLEHSFWVSEDPSRQQAERIFFSYFFPEIPARNLSKGDQARRRKLALANIQQIYSWEKFYRGLGDGQIQTLLKRSFYRDAQVLYWPDDLKRFAVFMGDRQSKRAKFLAKALRDLDLGIGSTRKEVAEKIAEEKILFYEQLRTACQKGEMPTSFLRTGSHLKPIAPQSTARLLKNLFSYSPLGKLEFQFYTIKVVTSMVAAYVGLSRKIGESEDTHFKRKAHEVIWVFSSSILGALIFVKAKAPFSLFSRFNTLPRATKILSMDIITHIPTALAYAVSYGVLFDTDNQPFSIAQAELKRAKFSVSSRGLVNSSDEPSIDDFLNMQVILAEEVHKRHTAEQSKVAENRLNDGISIMSAFQASVYSKPLTALIGQLNNELVWNLLCGRHNAQLSKYSAYAVAAGFTVATRYASVEYYNFVKDRIEGGVAPEK